MLDDANVLKQRDPHDFLGFLASQPAQLSHSFGLGQQHFGDRPIYNVVFAGMGGSSLAAELALTWPQLKEPFIICRDYNLPSFVDADTLVVASSYSGNTAEAISALQQAKQKGAQLAVIAHDGKLSEMAQELGCVHAVVPECPVPRSGMLYDFRALIEILVAARLAPEESLAELEALVAPLQSAVSTWVADIPTAQNQPKQLALNMAGKIPIIYAGPRMYPAAYRWKIGINENAKTTSWCNQYPEVDHNEFMGWTSHPIDKPFAVVDLLSSYEDPHILQRFPLTDRMLSGMRPHATTIDAQGASLLEHLLYTVLLGDFTSTYLGIVNGVNPAQVDLAEKFKLELAKG